MQRFTPLLRTAAAPFAVRAAPSVAPVVARAAPCTSVAVHKAVDAARWNSDSRIDMDYSSVDDFYNENQLPAGDPHGKRAFTYLVLGGGRFLYASAARLAVIKFITTMSAAADTLALASLEVELGKVNVGQCITVKWRGKPVFIKNRTAADIDAANSVDVSSLRDPQKDAERVRGDPKWLVVLGICTHLGCVPIANAGEYNGWFCPCHGSHYDTSGRIRKGPAPENLEIPPYSFLDGDAKLLIG